MYRTIKYKPNAPLAMAEISLGQIEDYEKFEYSNIQRLVK